MSERGDPWYDHGSNTTKGAPLSNIVPTESRDLRFTEIIIDDRFDARQGFVDWQAVEDYSSMAPGTCPNGKVFWDDSRNKFILLAGRHRMEARKKQGLDFMTFDIYPKASEKDLYAIAVADNTDAKVRYTDEQAERAIMRLFDLGFGGTEIGIRLGFGKNKVDKVIRATRAKEMIGEIPGLARTHYQELYTAPDEIRNRLARIAARKGWTAGETRVVVQGFKRDTYTPQMKQRILRGQMDPIAFDQNGEMVVHKKTLSKSLAARTPDNPLIELLELIVKFERWQDRLENSNYEFVNLDPARAKHLDMQLARLGEIVGSVRMELIHVHSPTEDSNAGS